MAIVLGVAGMILGAIWTAGTNVTANARINRLNLQIMNVVQNVRQYYGVRGILPANAACNGTTDITCIVDSLNPAALNPPIGLIPVEMRTVQKNAGSTINHAAAILGTGSFHIFAQTGAGGPRTVLRVQLLGLTKPDCIKLLMQFPALMPEVGVARIANASTSTTINLMNIAAPGTPNILPFTGPTALSWCNLSANNEIDIDFNLNI